MNQPEVRSFHIRSDQAANLEAAHTLEARVAVFVVTWNLNKERQNYPKARAEFIAQFEHIEHIKDPGLESVIFISINNSADKIATYLRQKMDNNDRLLVTKLNRGECEGFLSGNVVDWINSRF